MTAQAGDQAGPIPGSHEDLLHSNALANVATIGPHGEPQVNPVWFDWDGQNLLFSQTRGRQKLKNLTRDPRVAISIVDPANPYRYLELRGVVVNILEDPGKQFINSLTKKYMDQDVYPWSQPTDERVIVMVRPERTTHMG